MEQGDQILAQRPRVSVLLRTKEDAEDYRYFPSPTCLP